MDKWDTRLLDMCKLIASWSKDPSTQVGAVIVDRYNHIRGTGYNGFPRKVEYNDASRLVRPKKYNFMVHAEANAIVQAGFDASVGGKLYLATIPQSNFALPCSGCAGLILNAGIVEVVYCCGVRGDEPVSRWREDLIYSQEMLAEAGVIMREVR